MQKKELRCHAQNCFKPMFKLTQNVENDGRNLHTYQILIGQNCENGHFTNTFFFFGCELPRKLILILWNCKHIAVAHYHNILFNDVSFVIMKKESGNVGTF